MNVTNPGINKGIYFGITSIILGLILYSFSPVSYLPMRSIIVFIISFFFIYSAGLAARDTLGGHISFKEAFVPSFSTWIIGTLISTLFAYVFINYIDPSIIELALQQAINSLDEAEVFMGEEMYEAAKDSLETNGLTTGIAALLGNWLLGLVVGAGISFVVSHIVKREMIEML